MSWWVDELVSWWVDELMSWWVGELVSWWVGELVSWWVDKLISWWVFKLKGAAIFSPFHLFTFISLFNFSPLKIATMQPSIWLNSLTPSLLLYSLLTTLLLTTLLLTTLLLYSFTPPPALSPTSFVAYQRHLFSFQLPATPYRPTSFASPHGTKD